MADDFQVKQSSSNSGAYGLGGAVVGGLGAGAAAHYFTKPKYGSYEDILAEAKDETSFTSKIDKAEGEEKNFLKEAQSLAGKKAEAEAEYNKKFSEWKEKNPANAIKEENEDYKKLVQAEEDANKKLTEKKNELINKEIEKLKTSGSTKKSVTIEKALKNKSEQIFKATKRVIELQDAGASKEEIAKATAHVNTLQKEADELASKIAEQFGYGKLKDEALDNKKKEVVEAYKLNMQDRVNQKLKGFDTPIESEHSKLSKEFMSNRKAIATEKEALSAVEKELGKITGINIEAFRGTAHEGMLKSKLVTVMTKEDANIEKLKTLKEAYAKIAEQGEVKGEFSFKTLLENLKKLGTPGAKLESEARNIEAELTKYLTETEGLSQNQQENLRKLINGEINEKTIQEAINASEQRLNSIKELFEKGTKIDANINKLNEDASQIQEKLNKKGVYVRAKDGVVIDKKTGKPVETPKPAAEAAPNVKLPKGVKKQADARIEYSPRDFSNLTEEELRQQAETRIEATAYKAEADAVEAAKKARETAYNGLKDGAVMSDAEREAAFLKEIGAESKAKYTENAVKEAETSFKNKFKNMLERRYGFAEHANWKIAGVAAAGALVVGAIASAFAPKNN